MTDTDPIAQIRAALLSLRGPWIGDGFTKIHRDDVFAALDAQDAEIERLREDAARLDWIEQQASRMKIELARSIMGKGFEIGEWPSLRVTVTAGTLREVIDAARGKE